ncbi:SIS domain-containing protein [Pontibacillus yanchengensis]|uniref:SIS domain-containing protein n=2 Tax=Pontibacillus yanchengensis TaxID=462910 RepID=A0ACC7VIK9_9BACI|nr:MurR/RpiR family transcriptional regulator [Pontibacillus yanchengensis]MYL33932.1 SIS domain-containing protein [Pontibacillus yanchengensis]MYL53965.1 SIS domain-containing protein [Pontibacillus yanchengensis]
MNQQPPIQGKLVSTINSYYPSLTKSEQKVASTVLENIEAVLYGSVTDLADRAGVGETTALRFCRKIGFRGYQEFKLAIAKDLSNPTSEEHDSEKPVTLSQSLATHAKHTIDETLQMVDDQTVDECIDALNAAHTIHFFGVGTSGVTAMDAKMRFLRIGFRTDAIIDPHVQSMTAATLGEGNVVVGISVSGSTKDTIDSLSIAKENGATVIVITHYVRSPITKIADYVLLSGGRQSPLEGGSIGAKMSQLYLIDILSTGLAIYRKEQSVGMKQKTADSVVDKSY